MESTFWRYVMLHYQIQYTRLTTRVSHLWWNAGYFGCIFKVREVLPKPEVSARTPARVAPFAHGTRPDEPGAPAQRPNRRHHRRLRRHRAEHPVRPSAPRCVSTRAHSTPADSTYAAPLHPACPRTAADARSPPAGRQVPHPGRDEGAGRRAQVQLDLPRVRAALSLSPLPPDADAGTGC